MKPWIGVDFDGTLAVYNGWKGASVLGEPVPLMVQRVKDWLSEGKDVRILTARVWYPEFPQDDADRERQLAAIAARFAIEAWCETHIGIRLPITCQKDFGMVELWDDRCVQVQKNTGKRMTDIAFTVGASGGSSWSDEERKSQK